LIVADGDDVVFDNNTSETSSVPEGDYRLTAEQPSTRLFGSVKVSLADKDQDRKLFLLDEEGVIYLVGVHECENGKEPCDCDEHCICRIFNHHCTERVCQCDSAAAELSCDCEPLDPCAQCDPCAQFLTQTQPCVSCESVTLCSPYGYCCPCAPCFFPGYLLGLAALSAISYPEPISWWTPDAPKDLSLSNR
ncbi:MAG: hypothetical protein J6X44_07235, partial [Thermoguttaceae bacterium]|nr:hypothetical protein [Thermoguttaceae bacterium]